MSGPRIPFTWVFDGDHQYPFARSGAAIAPATHCEYGLVAFALYCAATADPELFSVTPVGTMPASKNDSCGKQSIARLLEDPNALPATARFAIAPATDVAARESINAFARLLFPNVPIAAATQPLSDYPAAIRS